MSALPRAGAIPVASAMLLLALLASLASLARPSQEEPVDRLHQLDGGQRSSLGNRALIEALADRGIELEGLFVSDASRVLSGGERTGEALRGLLDVGATLDLETLVGGRGHLHAGAQWIRGTNGSRLAGDVQGFSNIDAEPRSQLARFFWEDSVGDLHVRAGKMDANAVFAVVEAGGRFLAASAGFSPTILGLPTYPDPAFGLTVGRFTAEGSGVRLGLFDGSGATGVRTGSLGPGPAIHSPSALFAIGEGLWMRESTRLVIGAWHLDTDLARFDGSRAARAAGMYSVGEVRVVGSATDAAGTVDVFAQVGTAPAALSPVRRHLAAGALWRGPFAARESDRIGLYASHARVGDDPAAVESGELELELFYSLLLTPWMRLEPDLQFVRNPGASGLDDAWIGTLRLSFSL